MGEKIKWREDRNKTGRSVGGIGVEKGGRSGIGWYGEGENGRWDWRKL